MHVLRKRKRRRLLGLLIVHVTPCLVSDSHVPVSLFVAASLCSVSYVLRVGLVLMNEMSYDGTLSA